MTNMHPISLLFLITFQWAVSAMPVKEIGGMNSTQWGIFNNNPNLVDGWFRYHIPVNTRAELKALKGAAGNDYPKVINFLEHYGDAAADVVQKIKNNPKLIEAWAKVDANPLNAAVHSATIKNIDYLEIVHNLHNTSTMKNGKVITFEHHIAGEMTEITHNGVEHIIDYSGFHFDFKITEITPITPTITNINGTPHMTGPIPTSNTAVVRKAGTSNTVNGIENSEILVWGYGRVRNANPPPRWSLALDNAGNPIKAWVSKSSNGGKTSLFPGWNAEKTINEVAYARLNLNTGDWVRPNNPSSFSNEWRRASSEGIDISMYISLGTNSQPLNVPSFSAKVYLVFPK